MRAPSSTARRAFVYVGPRRSLTGFNADEWIAVQAGHGAGDRQCAARAVKGSVDRRDSTARRDRAASSATLQALAKELARGRSRRSDARRRAAATDALDVALAVTAINKALGTVGVTIKPASRSLAFDGIVARRSGARRGRAHERAVRSRIAFVRGANPAYTLPKRAKFADAFAKVPFKVSFSSYPDETTELCDLVLPDHHSLESWGDAEPVHGTIGCSSRRWIRCSTYKRARTADVLIAVAKTDPATASKYPAPTIARG